MKYLKVVHVFPAHQDLPNFEQNKSFLTALAQFPKSSGFHQRATSSDFILKDILSASENTIFNFRRNRFMTKKMQPNKSNSRSYQSPVPGIGSEKVSVFNMNIYFRTACFIHFAGSHFLRRSVDRHPIC
ncbi:hypothetical protein CDAR_163781 [Caerostris darwini]|uniref:Uncharacterized protein n=1 Tax=Caerostris darwini TaxID=1538125 RepID=A0AAV4RT49_9ARAC|nr:hypothetical protein CDAR_163781 [Caerostris darwini]